MRRTRNDDQFRASHRSVCRHSSEDKPAPRCCPLQHQQRRRPRTSSQERFAGSRAVVRHQSIASRAVADECLLARVPAPPRDLPRLHPTTRWRVFLGKVADRSIVNRRLLARSRVVVALRRPAGLHRGNRDSIDAGAPNELSLGKVLAGSTFKWRLLAEARNGVEPGRISGARARSATESAAASTSVPLDELSLGKGSGSSTIRRRHRGRSVRCARSWTSSRTRPCAAAASTGRTPETFLQESLWQDQMAARQLESAVLAYVHLVIFSPARARVRGGIKARMPATVSLGKLPPHQPGCSLGSPRRAGGGLPASILPRYTAGGRRRALSSGPPTLRHATH